MNFVGHKHSGYSTPEESLMHTVHLTKTSSTGTPLQYSAWKIPWTEEPGGLQSIWSQRVGHDRSDLAATAAAAGGCLTKVMPFALCAQKLGKLPWMIAAPWSLLILVKESVIT